MPLFSVIIATYNRASLLSRALQSVFAQTFVDYEVIVVDDGSIDDTDQVLAAYAGRIKSLRQPNQGPGRARNYALSEAAGTYVTFLDSDDLLLPWALATYKEVIERFNQPAFVLGSVIRFGQEDDISRMIAEPLVTHAWDDYLQSARAHYRVAMPSAIKRELLQEIGGFAEQNICSEGHDLYLRIGTAKGFVMISAPAVYAYLQHAATRSRNTQPLYKGARLLLSRERTGVYPGGKARRVERSILLTRSLRYSIRRCFELGDRWRGFDLYLRALPYYFRAGYGRDALQDAFIPFKHERLRRL